MKITMKALGIATALGTAGGAVVIGCALTSAQAGASAPFSGTPVTALSGASPVTIDASAREVFTPGSVDAASSETPADAYGQWSALTKDTGLPSDATVTSGTLTLPYHAKDRPVYAYSWHQCRTIIGAAVKPGSIPRTTPILCTHWLFLDAATGDGVDETWAK